MARNPNRICNFCGQSAVFATDATRYCSDECRERGKQKALARRRERHSRACKWCKKDMKRPLASSVRYCSDECRENGRIELKRREYHKSQYSKTSSPRDSHLRRRYGISEKEWEELFESQGRRCVFGCELPSEGKWHTDHNHETGVVRGILCPSHNLTLGFVEKSLHELEELLSYLRRDS